MIITKVFEIRDKGTFIPVLASKLGESINTPNWQIEEDYLVRRAGFSKSTNYVVVTCLTSLKATYDIFAWDNRTMRNAHQYILENFDTLKGGEVIDVEYILGETQTPRSSERIENHVGQRET